LPDLSNVHFLERGLNWSTVAYIVFVSLAAATSFLLALFASRLTAAKDAQIKTLQSTSAEAHARSQTALTHRDQPDLEADMEPLQAQHEELQKENLELQLALEKERAARLQLEERLNPRHMSAEQRRAIPSALAPFQGQKLSIVTYPGDPEIAAFAGEIRATLAAAGIAVKMAPALVFGKPQSGIALEVGVNRRRFATALAKAFVDAKVCTGPISASEADDADLLEITVGPK